MPQPSDQELAALKFLLERFQQAESYCRPYFDRAKRHYKLYRFGTAVSDKDWPYINRVRTRDILAFVEDTTAILIQTLFATMPFISVIPRESNNPVLKQLGIDIAKIGKQMERCLDYQLSHEDTDFFEEIIDYFKGGGIQGNGYLGVYPRFEADGTYLIPKLEVSDFWDVLPVPGSKRLSKSRGVFIRQFCTYDDLLEYQDRGIYKNADQLRKGDNAGPDQLWHKRLLEEVGLTDYASDEEDIEVLHYFSGGHVLSIGNRRAFLRDSTTPNETTGQIETPYPYHMPVVQYKHVPVPGEFFAMGIPEILELLQEDKNLIRSVRRDNIDIIVNKIIKARSGADINFDFLRSYPGAIWPVENLNDIEPWEPGDVTQSAYGEERVIAADMENALSMFGYARGMTPAHTEQPTTVMKLQQASMNRQDVNIKLAEFTVLQEIARKIIALNRRYMTRETYEAIIGEQDAGFYAMPEHMITRFFLMKPVGSSVTHIKEIRQNQINFAIQSLLPFIQNPQLAAMNIQPFAVDSYEALKTAMDTADIKNIDSIIKLVTPPQTPIQTGMQMTGLQMPPLEEIAQLAGVSYGGMQQ